MRIIKRKIAELKGWDDNPRTLTEDNYLRLKAQLERLGVYKPLLITDDNVVVGGNMRLRALTELGHVQVECSVLEFVETDGKVRVKIGDALQPGEFEDKKQAMLEYAMSDNDHVGSTDEAALAELIMTLPQPDALPRHHYSVDRVAGSSVDDVLKEIVPHPDDEDDEKEGEGGGGDYEEEPLTCPACGHEFTPDE